MLRKWDQLRPEPVKRSNQDQNESLPSSALRKSRACWARWGAPGAFEMYRSLRREPAAPHSCRPLRRTPCREASRHPQYLGCRSVLALRRCLREWPLRILHRRRGNSSEPDCVARGANHSSLPPMTSVASSARSMQRSVSAICDICSETHGSGRLVEFGPDIQVPGRRKCRGGQLVVAQALLNSVAEKRHVSDDPIGLARQLVIHVVGNDAGENLTLGPGLVEFSAVRQCGDQRLPGLDVDFNISLVRWLGPPPAGRSAAADSSKPSSLMCLGQQECGPAPGSCGGIACGLQQ